MKLSKNRKQPAGAGAWFLLAFALCLVAAPVPAGSSRSPFAGKYNSRYGEDVNGQISVKGNGAIAGKEIYTDEGWGEFYYFRETWEYTYSGQVGTDGDMIVTVSSHYVRDDSFGHYEDSGTYTVGAHAELSEGWGHLIARNDDGAILFTWYRR